MPSPGPGGDARRERGRTTNRLQRLPVAVLFFASVAPHCGADQIQIGEEIYTGAEVLAFEEGRLKFRTGSGGYRTTVLENVTLLLIEETRGFADFNDAERYVASGEPIKALVRYRRARRELEGFWADVALLRMLRAAGRAERIDESVEVLLEALADPQWRSTVLASLPSVPEDSVLSRLDEAARRLGLAIAATEDQETRTLLRLLRYEVMTRTDPVEAGRLAPEVSGSALPPGLRTERLYGAVVDAVRRQLRDGAGEALLAALDRHLRDAPDGILPDLLLLKGAVQLRSAATREDALRASWAFLRVIIHMPEYPRVGEGYLGAAEALERAGDAAEAQMLLERCLEGENITPDVRTRAVERLARLQAGAAVQGIAK